MPGNARAEPMKPRAVRLLTLTPIWSAKTWLADRERMTRHAETRGVTGGPARTIVHGDCMAKNREQEWHREVLKETPKGRPSAADVPNLSLYP